MKTIKIFTEYITLNINEFINTFIVGARTSLRRVITPSLAVALLAVALLASCGKGDDISDEPEPETPETPDVPATPVAYTFVVSADSLHAYAKGSADTITVRSFADSLATPFTLSDKPEWVSATALNDSVFEITIEANPVKAPREGLLTFTQTASDTAVYVKIAQNELHTKYVWKKGSIELPDGLTATDYNSVYYVDNDSLNAFAMIKSTYLYSTSDGGRNWTLVNDKMDYRSLDVYQSGNGVTTLSWMHFTSTTEGVYVGFYQNLFMFKTVDGGKTWTEIEKNVKTRGYVVPSDPALPEYFTDEYISSSARMTTMAVSRDNKWDSPLILDWPSRYDKANTGCITSDYTFIGTWDGRVCRAKTEDVLNSGGDVAGFTMEEIPVGYEGDAYQRGFSSLQEAGGSLYMRSRLTDNTLYSSQLGYILKSTDRGATWSSFSLNDNLPEAWKDLPQSTSSVLYFDNIIALDSECVLAFLHARDKSTNTYHYVVCLISLKEGKIIREMPLTDGTYSGISQNQNFASAYNSSNILFIGNEPTGESVNATLPYIAYLAEEIIDEEAETNEN